MWNCFRRTRILKVKPAPGPAGRVPGNWGIAPKLAARYGAATRQFAHEGFFAASFFTVID